ncbi:ceramide synthase 4 isoform X1 [Dasypus novemcinctus]|uniref:ceramide synthase 4 isoform X1 n=1 Tax=Dasypus novemcinctus TaxID=9361 RepID=UPI00265F2A83|nr:ceramide synthase 4 isoform X2 [Dasypus novemcinctus]XP_058137884.1 ceramide synthase 4 isoform X2 [Dasypus novemcinctus]
MWSSLNEWLWQDKFWLPPNNSWAELEDRDGIIFAHPRDMLAALPLALALVVGRITFERFVGLPLGWWLGLRDQVRKPVVPNAVLEKHFHIQGRIPKESQLALLATQCGLTLRQTQRWFRNRRNQDRPRLSKKFCEASWRFLFYLCSSIGGFAVLYHESWLWTPSMCWDNYPGQPLKPTLYWWYLLELSFYISLVITLPFDVKRKDFKEQVVHHFVAITLIIFSYCTNLLRIGSLVMLLHDCSDVLMEACKMFNYTHHRWICDPLFLLFSFVFIYTRLVLFPTRILYTTYYESLIGRGPFFGFYFFNTLLALLQLLHIFWSCLILQMVYNFIKKGQMEKDVRSDVEELDSGEDAKEPLRLRNGAAPTEGPRNRAARQLANGHVPAT